MRSSIRYPASTTARHRRRALPSLAAERHDPYDIAPRADDVAVGGIAADVAAAEARTPGAVERDPASGTAGSDRAPFGLPVLAELPGLAGALSRLADADAAMLEAVAGLADLCENDEVAQTTGVGLDHWVGIVARHTRMDRRFLLRAAHQLTRYPALRTAVGMRAVSWPQLRGLSLALREVPPVLTDRIDHHLGLLVDGLDADADPDAIIDQLRDTLAAWKAELTPDPVDATSGNRLTLQPHLDGTGGQGYLDLDAIGLAILDETTHPHPDQLDHPGGHAAARADNLLTRLTHTCHPDTTANRADGHHGSDHGGHHGEAGQSSGSDGGEVGTDDHCQGGESSWMKSLPAPKLLLRAELSDLLDTDLLTRLVGGKLRLTADAARRLCDTRGVELRTIIVDHGTVVGVGRATRRPPGWLTDIVAALHDTCTGPLCDRPARGAQLDHAVPWWPTGPDQPYGTTDVDNIGPLCKSTNQTKEAAGWQAIQTADGRRRWHHPRTGLTTTSIPATWRPSPPTQPPPHPHRRRPPDGADPPEPRPADDAHPPRSRWGRWRGG
jgi:hypothetical protein